MPTLSAIVQEMCRRSPADSIGRTVAIASLTTTTAVISALATGTVSAQKYINKWLWRPDTATAADRIRIVSNFSSSTGTLTHAGTNYADTTATSENAVILEHDPNFLFDAIQITLDRTRRIDRVVIPTRANQKRYSLTSPMSWVLEPQQIQRVALTAAPWLNNNRRFEKWTEYQSSALGTLNADSWTLAGGSATYSRSTTYTRRGQYVAALTRAGTDCTLSQTLNLHLDGVAVDDLVGETVSVVAIALATVASRLRFALVAGTTTGSTSYHAGATTWEELSTSITVPTDATDITIRGEVNTGNTTGYIDELYAFRGASITDLIRRANYEENVYRREDYTFEQTPNGLVLVLNSPPPRDQQIVIYSERPYTRITQSRIDAGTGDSDSTDCLLDIVATGALGRLYEGLSQRSGEDSTKYGRLAGEWNGRYEKLALAHRGGVVRSDEAPIPSPRLAAPAGRW